MLSLVFADSFAHYNDTALKWSSGGGVFETDPIHVRTGPQSLRIQAGDSPSILNLRFPVNTGAFAIQPFASFTLGFALQIQSLTGETIVELWCTANLSPSPAERQFFLVQNSDGSISVLTGSGTGTLIGTTAPGVLTIGPWWYIELTVDMNATTLVLTVTDAANVVSTVFSASGFATSQTIIDSLFWGGPSGANSTWIADFYFAFWDGLAPSVIGAPKIYGLVVPNADGFGKLDPGRTPPPFNVTAAPWWSQVNIIPQQTVVFIQRNNEAGDVFANPIGQAFQYDVSTLPAGATIGPLQVTMFISMAHDVSGSVPQVSTLQGNTGDVGSFNSYGNLAGLDSTFLFYPFPFDQDPVNLVPWTIAEFTGLSAFQIGPLLQQPG